MNNIDRLGVDNIGEPGFIDVEGSDIEDITDMQNDIDSQIGKLFEEFGGDSNDVEFKIHVKRAIPGKGEMEVCFQCTASELPITDRIIKEFGHGTYEIWIYKNGKRFRKRILNIAKPLKQTQPVIAPINSSSDIAQLIAVMSENQRQSVEQLQGMLAANTTPKPSVDFIGLLTAAAPVIAILKDVIKPPDTMGTFMKAASFMNEIKHDGGASDKEGNFYDMVGNLAKSFAPGIIDLSKQQQELAASGIPQGQVVPATPVQQIGKEDIMINESERAQLKQQLGMLCLMASQNKDPALYADLIIDQLPEDYIRRFILRSDFMAFLTSIEPRVKTFEVWFSQLQQLISGAYTEPPTVDDELTREDKPGINGDNTIEGIPENAASEPAPINAKTTV